MACAADLAGFQPARERSDIFVNVLRETYINVSQSLSPEGPDRQFAEENPTLPAPHPLTNVALILLIPTQPWVTPLVSADPISQ
jgi:hypothetical protein